MTPRSTLVELYQYFSNWCGAWRRLILAFATVGITFAFSTQVHAIDIEKEGGLITDTIASGDLRARYDEAPKNGAQTVNGRPREHVAPDGGRIGMFAVFPSVDTRIRFDDNVFGSSKDKTGDFSFEVEPQVFVASDLPRHIVNMAFGANLVRYARHSELNFADYNAAINGGLHIDHAHTLGVSVSSTSIHQRPGSLELSSNIAEPVPVFNHIATVGLTHDAGRLYGTVSATARRVDYQDAVARDGTQVDQDVRDMDFLSTQLRAGYRISPGFEVIGKARLLRQLHSANVGVDYDATGYEGGIGLSFETSPLLRWSVLGGYGIRDYDAAGLDSVNTGILEANFEWLPTQRLTIVGGVTREFVDTVGIDFGGRVDTRAQLRADIELYNNLVLSLGGGFTDSDFNDTTRTDRTYAANAELQYYLNKNLVLSLEVEHQTRESNLDEFDLDRNSIMVGAKVRY